VLKAVGRKVIGRALGRARLQPVFETLYEVSLAGLNFGEGNHPTLSGERFVIEFVARRLAGSGPPVVLFDVGANTGAYVEELVAVFGRSARILAFEPAPQAFQSLQARLGETDNVELYNIGFSDEDRQGSLYSPLPGSKLASVHDISARLERLGMSVMPPEQVALKTIDGFCAAEAIHRIDFLKLDIEGHELRALLGARQMLEAGRIGAIQFEFSAANLDSRTYFRDFYDLLAEHYVIHRVLQDGLYEIGRYRESHEIFKRATNYLALLKPRS
jgi:FkbM family methyltransferase